MGLRLDELAWGVSPTHICFLGDDELGQMTYGTDCWLYGAHLHLAAHSAWLEDSPIDRFFRGSKLSCWSANLIMGVDFFMSLSIHW